MAEEWRPVRGYEGFYEASSLGRVRRVLDEGYRYIAQGQDKKGYLRCKLSKHGIDKTHRVHRLVAEAFLGPCPPKRQVNHKDGIKTNNSITNLEYTSNTRNRRHAVAMGLNVNLRGEAHPNAKTRTQDVRQIRTLYRTGQYPARTLASMFGISETQVRRILKRENWRDLR